MLADPVTIDQEHLPSTRTSNCPPASDRPKALGYLRTDLSGAHTLRHTAALHRHARALGYQYVYTIHPPEHLDDPLGYALHITAALAIDTLIIYDLSHVDDYPARACTAVDLETVCPPTTWARAADHPRRTAASAHLRTRHRTITPYTEEAEHAVPHQNWRHDRRP